MTWPIDYTLPIDSPSGVLTLNNVGAQTIYLGQSSVTAITGLSLAPGTVLNIGLAPYGGTHISIATAEPVTLPKPKPTLGDHISHARLAIEKLPAGHARTMALHALTEASLWATEAKK
jgi:hypothetical protein